jgi:hypothetical protein
MSTPLVWVVQKPQRFNVRVADPGVISATPPRASQRTSAVTGTVRNAKTPAFRGISAYDKTLKTQSRTTCGAAKPQPFPFAAWRTRPRSCHPTLVERSVYLPGDPQVCTQGDRCCRKFRTRCEATTKLYSETTAGCQSQRTRREGERSSSRSSFHSVQPARRETMRGDESYVWPTTYAAIAFPRSQALAFRHVSPRPPGR